jgi:hypothetical protein
MKKLSTITLGLIAIDPMSEDKEMVDIVHFVGYWNKPTKKEVEHLKEELKTDEEFGLTEIADRLVILPAPDHIVEHYKNLE